MFLSTFPPTFITQSRRKYCIVSCGIRMKIITLLIGAVIKVIHTQNTLYSVNVNSNDQYGKENSQNL
jgi:hypothetical protein